MNDEDNDVESEITVSFTEAALGCEKLLKFDDTIVIGTRVTSYDGKQIEVTYQICDEKTNENYAMAKSKHFFTNKSGIPISLGRIYPELDTTFFEMK